MAIGFRLSTGFAAALFIVAAVSPAVAQEPRTVAVVDFDMHSRCVAGANGAVVDQADCLVAIIAAIATGNAFAALGQSAPQVDIGFHIGHIVLEFPGIAQTVIDLLDESGNAALALGVSNGLGANWVGPRPIISPA